MPANGGLFLLPVLVLIAQLPPMAELEKPRFFTKKFLGYYVCLGFEGFKVFLGLNIRRPDTKL